MANEEHLKILKQGVEVWNTWREENSNVIPDLRMANLHGAYLIGANLSGADLSRADFSGAYLMRADLSRGDLAVGTSAISMTIVPPGTGEIQDTSKQLAVFRKSDGSWLVSTLMFNSDIS